jgi:hypothetical protein
MEINVEETGIMRMLRHPFPVKNMIDQKQPENMDYLNILGSKITNDARRTREINPGLPWHSSIRQERNTFYKSNWT